MRSKQTVAHTRTEAIAIFVHDAKVGDEIRLEHDYVVRLTGSFRFAVQQGDDAWHAVEVFGFWDSFRQTYEPAKVQTTSWGAVDALTAARIAGIYQVAVEVAIALDRENGL